MLAFLSQVRLRLVRRRAELLSVAAHSMLLLFLVGGVHVSPRVAPYRLPGTALGVTPLTYYMPGSARVETAQTAVERREKTKPVPAVHEIKTAAQPELSLASAAQAGVGASPESGLGEGDIKIALLTYFPHPAPDLSSLPHGTKGDVILNAVIDEHGNISELTLLKGLGSPVDESVIGVVQGWKFTPAMKNGVPVVSEQELLFHYERS